ncbi:hypothetical protein DFS33DRAFT_1486309 [Desarmillaria ectypa]|nr:hypothetical protein DFS33DRAFT_1486309 [Desarmillaria ectypa]
MSSPFLFHSLDVGPRLSARKVHICRLYDVLELSLLRNDLPRARKAWAILARCKEMHWTTMWATAVRILGDETFDEHGSSKRLAFLREMMLQLPDKREMILKEVILRQIMAGHFKQALDELELYLPSFPYQDDPVLHNYAGLLSLYLSQPSINGVNDGMLSLDVTPGMTEHRSQMYQITVYSVVRSHIFKVQRPSIRTILLLHTSYLIQAGNSNQDSDDDLMEVDIRETKPQPQRKRVRLQEDRIS